MKSELIGRLNKDCLGAIIVRNGTDTIMVQLNSGVKPNREQYEALKDAEAAFIRFTRASKERRDSEGAP